VPALNAKLQLVAVEDSETDAQIAARHLTKAGIDCIVHRVETERDFASALHEIQPDLILSDFSLPQFDGLRALEIAVARAPETPFIFVSGTIGEERAIDALRRGATDYVLKTNLSRLSSAVERALREAALKAAQRQSEQQQGEQLRLERLARRQALDRLTRRINLVTQAAHIGLFERNTTNGEIWWSEVMFDIFGEDPSAFRPNLESWLAHVHPEDRRRVQDNAGNATRARTSPSVQYRILRGDGTMRHIQSIGTYAEYEAGDPTRLTGIVTDITERVESHQREQTLLRQLRESARKAGMAEIASNVLHDVSNVLDNLDTANTGALRDLKALRLDQPEQAGSILQAVQAELEAIDRLLRQWRSIVGAQQVLANAGGFPESTIDQDLTEPALPALPPGFMVESAEGLPSAGAPGKARPGEPELRRRLAALEETLRLRTVTLEQAKEQLREQMRLRQAVEVELGAAQKLEAVGRLAAGIAHEINTPIQYINDSAHLLGSAFEEMLTVIADAEQREDTDAAPDLLFVLEEVPHAIERIIEGAQRVAAIVRAMKEFADPDATEKTPADLNRAIESTLLIASSEYKDVATVQLYCGEIPEVMCNVGELSQVFLNLIVNSAHALADAGRDAESGRITIRTALVEEWVELQFEDNGCGISQEIIDKIYEPFFTTKELGRGSGQGLAIARSIVVDKHSGLIGVASTPGVGTCFTLRLPVGGPAADRS
jgi:signal transduction histidine kinase/DNA-binding response OmpR family regulator